MAKPQIIPAAGLYLVTPPIADSEAFAPALRSALGGAAVASVLLNLEARDDQAAKRIAREVAAIVQPHGAALVLNGWSAIVARSGADGIHVDDDLASVREALDSFKPERIVGVGRVLTRHDAMILAETGVDYVMFGAPEEDGSLPSLEDVVEQTGWWAELFEIPCVAFAGALEAVALLKDAGADFIAVQGLIWAHPGGPAEGAAAVGRILAEPRPVR